MTRATAKRGVAGIHMRHLNRGKLLTALESDNLVKRVVVAEGERLRIEQVPWDAYWEPVLECGEDLDSGRIGWLHQVWRRYILSGHEAEHPPGLLLPEHATSRSFFVRDVQRW